MKTLFRYALLCTLVAVHERPLQAESVSKNLQISAPVTNELAGDLYQSLKTQPDNISFSPTSIAMALAMLDAGARGPTAKEIEKSLHVSVRSSGDHLTFKEKFIQFFKGFFSSSKTKNQMHMVFKDMLVHLADHNPNDYELSLANKLFAANSVRFSQGFLDLTQTFYGARLEVVDYRSQASDPISIINKWVEKVTHDKIKNLVSGLDQNTIMVLVNAIYFHGQWKNKFESQSTKVANFTNADSQIESVPFMNRSGTFSYTDNSWLQMIEVPYKGEKISLQMILPKKTEDFPKLETTLQNDTIKELRKRCKDILVKLHMPKFRIESTFALEKILPFLGVKLAFTESADFSGMTQVKPIFINKVFHKSFVDVNEDGTEAAAATAITLASPSEHPKKVVDFNADHPFIYSIIDSATGQILFMGRVVKMASK